MESIRTKEYESLKCLKANQPESLKHRPHIRVILLQSINKYICAPLGLFQLLCVIWKTSLTLKYQSCNEWGMEAIKTRKVGTIPCINQSPPITPETKTHKYLNGLCLILVKLGESFRFISTSYKAELWTLGVWEHTLTFIRNYHHNSQKKKEKKWRRQTEGT